MKILHLISSPRGKASYSIKLANEIIHRLLDRYPGSEVKTHNLTTKPLPHLGDIHLQSFIVQPESRTPELSEAIQYSDNAIQDLMEADIIVIGAPMYNLSIHSSLKAWIDHIIRAGITFNYSAVGPEGLVTGKKVYLAISSGGIYSEGPMKVFDFTEPYLRRILSFIGLTDIVTFRVEGVAIPDIKETAFEDAVERLAL